ncbi:predicted protein [Nematostella vectensis]|uniref:RING-type domain-containing protein n=1 Tax=Nematostella vectensis TaxID=45351 RepID=A7S2V4_NEMVE|nr:tripartite motif-containing protein 2 [Nematostella vectensis]EDO41994.1 predicted protein [Nematostella vectensis]|eukprot:XP_001634057.1 predicted protein [Nematostella vectensis]
MATESHLSQVFSEELTCPVCLEELKEPKCLTSCAHNVCKPCLDRMTFNGEKEIRCPTCRRSTLIPDGGVKALPTNTILVRLLEATPGRKERIEIHKALEKGKPVVEEMTRKIRKLDTYLDSMSVNCQLTEERIHDEAEKIIELIRKHESKLCMEVQGFYGKKQKILQHQRCNLVKLLSGASSCIELAEEILIKGDVSEIIELRNALKEQLEEVVQLNLDESDEVSGKFVEELDFVIHRNATIGGLESNTFGSLNKKIGQVVSSASSADILPDWSKAGKVIHKIGHKGSRKGNFKSPGGVASNEFGEIAVSDFFNDRIQVFDSKGKFLFQFGKKGTKDGLFQGPTGVAYTVNSEIMVLDSRNHRIQIFNRKGEFLSKFGQRGSNTGELGWAEGLYVDGENKIIVTDTEHNRVQVFHADGSFKFMYGDTGTEGFDKPLNTVCHNGEYFTTDSGNFCIKVFNSDGEYVRQFGREGAGGGEFCCPRGLALDKKNELLLVCDSGNDSIHVFRLDGSFVTQLSTKKTPVGLALMNGRHLVVSSYYGHCVQVLSYI